MTYFPVKWVNPLRVEKVLLDNSITVNLGDFVGPSASDPDVFTNDGSVVAGTSLVKGRVIGFCGPKGEVLTHNLPVTSVTTPADNTTSKTYYAMIVRIAEDQVYEIEADADLGTTTHSDEANVYFDLASASQVDESSVVLPSDASAPLQVLSLGPTGKGNYIRVKFSKYLK